MRDSTAYNDGFHLAYLEVSAINSAEGRLHKYLIQNEPPVFLEIIPPDDDIWTFRPITGIK